MKNLIDDYSIIIGDVETLYKQHNIIAAPKNIKLSEIVNKIQEREKVEIYFNRERNAIGYGEYDEDWKQNTWQPLVIFGNMKIVRVCVPMVDFNKWLYTLWIAETIIEDDLKEHE